jgi:hypothetical protein
VYETFAKFRESTVAGIHLEKIDDVRDPRLMSIRIDNFWRGVVLAPNSGDAYLLLRVLPHDEAYQWAQRRAASVNRATGGIEIARWWRSRTACQVWPNKPPLRPNACSVR